MKISLCIFLAAALGLMVRPVYSLTPPLSPETLQQEADLIVEGEVPGPIECQALVEKNKCADQYRYSAPLKVTKAIKGTAKSGEVLKISFVHYDYGKSICVGDQGPNVQSGEAGTYYLKKTESGSWDLWHWSAVKTTRTGTGKLPKCRGNSRIAP